MALQEWIDSKYSSALDAYARKNAALPSLLLIYLLRVHLKSTYILCNPYVETVSVITSDGRNIIVS